MKLLNLAVRNDDVIKRRLKHITGQPFWSEKKSRTTLFQGSPAI